MRPKQRSNRQLHSLASADYQFPSYVDGNGLLQTRSAENLPLMIWPDGSWCHPANRFMRELLEKGQSRRNRGGSLAVTAAHITHLLRYCWVHRCDPIDLTDNQFIEFISHLLNETRLDDISFKQRDANTVIQIGRNCLAFMECIARYAGDTGFIGSEGRIRACMHEYQIKRNGIGRGSQTKTVKHWDHPALPNPAPQKKRMPISTGNIEAMRKAVGELSTTSHQRVRRHTMLKLLEVTGARRGEIALITVESVIQASGMEHPMLHIPTLKKRGQTSQYRYIPISWADLEFIKQYIEFHRKPLLRRLLKNGKDHGILLVNGRTGEALQANTVTDEISRLAKTAGIQEKTCPHMFRHRFLTKLFVALIEQHHIENTDQFRRFLIDSEGFKRKVAEWTDHSNLESLDRYIQLAFDEICGYKKVYHLVSAGLILDSFMGTIDAELDAIKSGEQPILVLDRLKNQLEKIKSDLANTMNFIQKNNSTPG